MQTNKIVSKVINKTDDQMQSKLLVSQKLGVGDLLNTLDVSRG